MQFLQNGGVGGCPLSGRKTAKVCWQPLKVRYYLISSLIIRFQLERSGLVGGESLRVLKISALILALIWESTPRSSSVYLRTSLSSLIEAIQFKLQIAGKLQMQPLSPKSIASTKKNIDRSNHVVDSQSYLPRLNSPKINHYGFRQPSKDFTYALSNYFQGKSSTFYSKIPSLKHIKNKRPALAEAEEKIFSEVIGLVGQIQEIKANIVSQLQSIQQIQIQNPDIEEKMRFHGYSQPLTIQQYQNLQEENEQLLKRIESMQAKKESPLELALASEKAQYQQLKQQLSQYSPTLEKAKANESKISEYKSLIAQLEKARVTKVKANYPGIDKLKAENQDLRQKTISFLKTDQLQTQEERELSEYLQKEEKNRHQFMQELKKFKGQFKRMKEQNETLRQRLAKKDKLNTKENSGSKLNTSKLDSNKSSLQVESFLGTKRDKLSQYQSFLRLMQQNVAG